MRPHKLRLFVNPLPIHFPLIYKINLNHQAAKILKYYCNHTKRLNKDFRAYYTLSTILSDFVPMKRQTMYKHNRFDLKNVDAQYI